MCGKRSSQLQAWRWKLSFTDRHWGWHMDASVWTAWNDSHSNGIVQLLFGRTNLRFALQLGKSWSLSVAERVILIDTVTQDKTIISGLYLQHLKSCRCISGEFNLTRMLLQSSFITTTHDHTQKWEHRKQSQKSDGMFFILHPYIQDVAPSGFYFFAAVKDAISGKRLGSDDKVYEEEMWLRVKNSNWCKNWIDALVSYWRQAVEIDRDYLGNWDVW